MSNLWYDPALKPLARQLRNNSTLAEVLLWNQLKRKQRKGFDFHRQRPIAHWIVDFHCAKLRLVIELDGGSHDYAGGPDEARQKSLEHLGLRFIRFEERYVRENVEGAVTFIDQWIDENAQVGWGDR